MIKDVEYPADLVVVNRARNTVEEVSEYEFEISGTLRKARG